VPDRPLMNWSDSFDLGVKCTPHVSTGGDLVLIRRTGKMLCNSKRLENYQSNPENQHCHRSEDPSKPLLLEGNRIVPDLRLRDPSDMMRQQIQGVSGLFALQGGQLADGPESVPAERTGNQKNQKNSARVSKGH